MRFARACGVDRAVGFAVLSRFWQVLTGPVTQLLIVFCFSATQQGYYYAFANLLAMQIFVELGLHVVIINVASHEWSGLELTADGIAGDRNRVSRLKSLAQTAFRWYSVAAVVFIIGIAVFGMVFFQDIAQRTSGNGLGFSWQTPWLALVLLTGLQLGFLPLTAILEGCGQLPVINRVRFWQGVAGSLTVWALMLSGFGLWALCGSAAVRLCGEIYLIRLRFGQFFAALKRTKGSRALSWKQEVLPLQWRMAIQGCLHWFWTHLAGLVVLNYHGAEASGRYGMMWTILAAVQAASLSWVETRRPLFGRLIAERNYGELDREFFRLTKISMFLVLAGSMLFTAGVWVAGEINWTFFQKVSGRLPLPSTVAMFSAAFVLLHPALCTNIYVRAHKRDPYLLPVLIVNPVIAAMIFWAGRSGGLPGVATAYLAGIGLILLPVWTFVWARTRKLWHQPEVTT